MHSSPFALGIGAASFANDVIAERAKIERKARRRSCKRSRNAQIKKFRISETQKFRISEVFDMVLKKSY